MTIINKEELNKIIGGTSISGTIINAFVKGINQIIEAGQIFGSAIRRLIEGSFCDLE